MFEFIKIEDIKSLCTHVVENFATTLDKITYVQVISRFRYLSSSTIRFWYIWTLNNPLISDVQGLEDEIRPAPGQNEVGHAMKSFKIIVPLNIWFVGSWFSLLFPSGTAVAWSQWTPCWELEHLGPKLGGSGGMIASLMRSGLNFWLVHNDRRGLGALKVYICP